MSGGGKRTGVDLSAATAALARGDISHGLRELLLAVVRAGHGDEALALGATEGDPREAAALGKTETFLRVATQEALQTGRASGRSDPTTHRSAAALPVRVGDRVVGALGAAGPQATFEPEALEAATDLAAIALGRSHPGGAVAAAAEALSAVAAAEHLDAALDAALAAVEPLFGGSGGFICRSRSGRLQVSRFRGFEREELQTLIATEGFRSLVLDWQSESYLEPMLIPHDKSGSLVVAPIHTAERAFGLFGAIIEPRDTGGVPRGLVALADALAARMAADEAQRASDLAASEAEGVLMALTHPVLVADADGRLVRANAPAATVLGLSGSFDLGRPVHEVINVGMLARALCGAEPSEFEVAIGEPRRTYRANVGQVIEEGQVVRRVVALQDVTDQREAAQSKADFVAVVGHELRTPITIVKGFAETLRTHGDALEPSQRENALSSVLVNARRLETLVEDLLFLSTESGRATTGPRPDDIAALCDQVVVELGDEHPEREIEVIRRGSRFEARVDRQRVVQVIRHLVDNALKYSTGPVNVEVTETDAGIEIAVTDVGPGIFSGDLEKIFDPFAQGDASTTRTHGGAGMGLYVSRRIVEAMGGRLDCDTRLGQGSRFSFHIPVGVAPSDDAASTIPVAEDAPA